MKTARPIPEFDRSIYDRWIVKGSEEECWPWIGMLSNRGPKPYGKLSMQVDGKWRVFAAHRLSVKLDGRDPPINMVVDHICRNRICVNPKHLRIVDQKTNTLENSVNFSALNAQKTHCPSGHPYSGRNLYYKFCKRRNFKSRCCRQCKTELDKKRDRRKCAQRIMLVA